MIVDQEHELIDLAYELNQLEVEIKRREYLRFPQTWVDERLGEKPWSKQVEIMNSVRDNRHTAVPSCFGSGKSWTAARLTAWWIDTHPPGTAFVVTTATTGRQVRAILWRELHRAHSKGNLPGRLNQTEWWMPTGAEGKEQIVAFGSKPADMDDDAFTGIHDRFVLVIGDEAAGLPKSLIEAADSLVVNEDSRYLLIGNPNDSSSEFAKICLPGSGWNVIRIRAWDTPNFTGEEVSEVVKQNTISKVWVEEKRKRWGEDNPMWIAKVEAEFPSTIINGLIPISAINAAIDCDLPAEGPNILGVDVGAGGDRNVVAHRYGGRLRIIRRNQTVDTMESCGNVIADLKKTKAEVAKVDYIGIGRGLVDRGREQDYPIIGIVVSQAPLNEDGSVKKKKKRKHQTVEEDQEAFVNVRAQAYWAMREAFLAEGEVDLDPEDIDLHADLVSIRYKRTSKGEIQIIDKAQLRKTLGHSPDDGDAAMLTYAIVPKERESVGATW